jgi:hypothetical protein
MPIRYWAKRASAKSSRSRLTSLPPVPGAIVDQQLGVRPRACQCPARLGRAAQMLAAVDRNVGNARQPPRLPDQHALLGERAELGVWTSCAPLPGSWNGLGFVFALTNL